MKSSVISVRLFVAMIFAMILIYGCKSDIETLREQFTDELLEGRVDETRINELITTLREEGTWPDINYADTSRTGFEHSRHLDNMVGMARAYVKQGSPLKGDPELKESLFRALDFWLANDFTCENWWNNQIGTPSAMVSLLLIMDEELSEEQTDKMLKIAGRAHLNASGARPSGDRIKIAGILAKKTLFLRDEKLAVEVMNVIEGEIKFAPDEVQQRNAEGRATGERIMYPGTGRGVQYDYSFHHRADRVNNTLSYGTGYADAFAEWAANVADTRLRFSDSSLMLLTDYYLDGICKQMIYSRIPDPGIKNRDISRPGSGRPMSTSTPERLIKAGDYRRAELENVIKSRKGEEVIAQSFAKFFWQTEHFVIQRPDWYSSVRMYSTRNRNMEQPYNGEGLTNHYRADGTNHISLTGGEYKDIAPVMDWRKIPGATILEGDSMPPENAIQKQGITDFVGGITDGLYGAAAFDFKSPHDGTSARKSWFFFDREYLCLGTGIQSDDRKYAVVTTLNQCLLDGEVTVRNQSGISTATAGNRKMDKVNWVYHDSVGYFFTSPTNINLFNQTATGTWFSINRQTSSSKNVVKKDLFRLWLDHGINPSDGSYEYVVLPASQVTDLENYASDPSIKVLSNNRNLQAVYHARLKLLYAVFYDPGTVQLNESLKIESESPGMVMISLSDNGIKTITVSDPSRKLTSMVLKINERIEKTGEGFKTKWDESAGMTTFDFILPQGKYAGKSLTIKL